MTGKPLIYWDACIFLGYLQDEKRNDPMDMLGVQELVTRIDKDDLQLVTSVVTLCEVLESRLTVDQKSKFESLFRRRNFHLVDVHSRIARIAHDIRDYYQQMKVNDNLPTVGTPDALHLGTAIYMECTRFYTFDEKDEPRKRRAIIPLSPVVAEQYNLIIEKPTPTQIPLLFPEEPLRFP